MILLYPLMYKINYSPHTFCEVIITDRKDLPLGFSMALAQQPEAMQKFSNMSQSQKEKILSEIHNINSKSEMQTFVANLAR